MQLPVMTGQLARRIQKVISASHMHGMVYLQQQVGNPFDIQIKRFGNATASMARAITLADWWNRVINMEEADAAYLDDILAFFRAERQPLNIDMEPTVFTDTFSKLLTERGLYPINNGTVLYGLPQPDEVALPPDVNIREVGLDELDLFVQLWADGFEFQPGSDTDTIKTIRKGTFSIPGSRRYIAYVNGTPAAMAGLYIDDGMGFLSGGATLPAFRKSGCHTALTQRRSLDAARVGCELMLGHTNAFGSISQNNMERAGLRIAYIMISWVDSSPSF